MSNFLSSRQVSPRYFHQPIVEPSGTSGQGIVRMRVDWFSPRDSVQRSLMASSSRFSSSLITPRMFNYVVLFDPCPRHEKRNRRNWLKTCPLFALRSNRERKGIAIEFIPKKFNNGSANVPIDKLFVSKRERLNSKSLGSGWKNRRPRVGRRLRASRFSMLTSTRSPKRLSRSLFLCFGK